MKQPASSAPRGEPTFCDVPEQPSAPGSRAPSFTVPGLLNSMPRILLRFGGAFSSFLRSSFADGAPTAPTCLIWPMPIPHPQVFRAPSGRSSWKLKALSLAVALLSWLYLGKPAGCPAEALAGVPLNRHQKRCVKRLEAAMFGTHFPFEFSSADLGRHAAKVESQSDVLQALGRAADTLCRAGGYLGAPASLTTEHAASPFGPPTQGPLLDSTRVLHGPPHRRAKHQSRGLSRSSLGAGGSDLPSYGQVVGHLDGPAPTTARPIVADRIKLPGPPQFSPEPFMDEATADRYVRPLAYAQQSCDCPSPPRVKVLGRASEKLKLYRALADTGRLRPARFPRGREHLGAGLFVVGKDQDRDRLILDARPANGLELGASVWTKSLASAVAVSNLVLEDDRCLLFSGADLRECFYQFQVGEDRLRRNMIADKLTLQQAAFVFRRDMKEHLEPDGFLRIAFASLAMGDCGACEYTQCAHLGVCVKGGVVLPGELLVHGAAPPRGLCTVGLVIDDLICLDRVLTSDLQAHRTGLKRSVGRERLDAALRAYRTAPLEVSEKKVFHEQVQASFWGVTVCGMSGWLKPNAHRLWSLVLVTLRTVELGLATQHLLESLAGCWISIFVLRRRLLAAMSLIFQAAAAGDPNVIVRLSPELRAELASFALLGQMCAVNLRAQVEPSVTATDASSSHQAAARAPLPQPVADEAYRHSVQKGAWTRLLTPQSAWLRSHDLLEPQNELPGDDEGYRASPLYCALAACPRYSELWSREYKSRVHINVAELDAFLREERRSGARRPCSRLLFGIDSQVTIGCVAKGRSASPRLNQLLERSIPDVLGFQSYSAPLYFPSHLNPSDDPTRGKAVRGPSMELPGWWLRLLEGDPSELDRVMKESGYGPGEHDFDQELLFLLGGIDSAVLQSANGRRAEACKAPFIRSCRRRLERDRAVTGAQRPKPPGSGELLSPAISELLSEFPLRLFVHRGSLPDLSRPGALEVYSERGRGARELIACGCPWVLCFRSGCSDERDLDTPELRGKLLRLLQERAFLGFCSSPYGASLSRACLPRTRSSAEPSGLRHLAPATYSKVVRDNLRADWIRRLSDACLELGLSFWVDCPDSSWWWRLPGWSDAVAPSAASTWRVDLCRFGAPWRKRTRVFTNTSLAGARLLCDRTGHRRLIGFSVAHRKAWTSVAKDKPRGFYAALALAFSSRCGWCADRPLCPAACAKLPNCCRIGEASKPGPRAPRPRDPRVDLETRPLYSSTSHHLGLRAWTSFLAWCALSLTFDPVESFVSCPALLAMVLRSYGNFLYQSGGSLQTYRYAILAAQRLSWSIRGHLGPAGTGNKVGAASTRTAQDANSGGRCASSSGARLGERLQKVGGRHPARLLWLGSHW